MVQQSSHGVGCHSHFLFLRGHASRAFTKQFPSTFHETPDQNYCIAETWVFPIQVSYSVVNRIAWCTKHFDVSWNPYKTQSSSSSSFPAVHLDPVCEGSVDGIFRILKYLHGWGWGSGWGGGVRVEWRRDDDPACSNKLMAALYRGQISAVSPLKNLKEAYLICFLSVFFYSPYSIQYIWIYLTLLISSSWFYIAQLAGFVHFVGLMRVCCFSARFAGVIRFCWIFMRFAGVLHVFSGILNIFLVFCAFCWYSARFSWALCILLVLDTFFWRSSWFLTFIYFKFVPCLEITNYTKLTIQRMRI